MQYKTHNTLHYNPAHGYNAIQCTTVTYRNDILAINVTLYTPVLFQNEAKVSVIMQFCFAGKATKLKELDYLHVHRRCHQ